MREKGLIIMKVFKDITLIFLTGGEVPATNNLISSQVFKIAEFIKKNMIFHDVQYIGFVPLRYFVSSFL